MITRMIKWVDEIWDDMLRHKSEWHEEEIYRFAKFMYTKKAFFKKRRLRNKVFACLHILLNDFSQDLDKYFLTVSYIILCIKYRIRKPKDLLKYMRKENLLLEPVSFTSFVERIFNVKCKCINAYSPEV